MNPIELMAKGLAGGADWVTNTLADFTDAEMFVRPVPGANHAAWQLGHITAGESMFVSGCGGKMPELPAGFADRFSQKTTGIDDPKQFASKAELIEQFKKVRAASVEWVKSLKPEDLDKPGPEMIRSFAPTVGSVVLLLNGHAMMHMGQMQVIRRKLGKKVLF